MDEVLRKAGVHPRGAALALRAENLTRGGEDERVHAHYRLRDMDTGAWSEWRHILLTYQGDGVHEQLVDTTGSGLEVYFATADNQTDVESIALIPPPTVRRAYVEITPPAYASGRFAGYEAELGPGTDDRAVTKQPALVGSQVRMALEVNKPLPTPDNEAQRAAWLNRTFDWPLEQPMPTFSVDANDARLWTLSWPLRQTRTLRVTLIDEHELTNDEPITYRIESLVDTPPAVTIVEPQTDETVLPTAVVALAAEARDDVAVADLALEGRVQKSAAPEPDSQADAAAWREEITTDSATATMDATLDLTTLGVMEGDTVHVVAIGRDIFDLDGQTHDPAYSPVRRLRVISELDFATAMRRELGSVRQNAIRIESLQSELQDDVMESGVQPGVDRAQAQIGERIAQQREALEDLKAQMDANRLEDEQLEQLMQQASDLLDHAGRAASRAAEQIQQNRTSTPSESASDSATGESSTSEESSTGEQSPDGGDSEAPDPDGREGADEEAAAPEDQPIVDAQQQVREELADLIELLDRDEDTWVVTRMLEGLLEEQQRTNAATEQLSQETVGQTREEMSPEQREQLDRLAQQQQDLAERSRQLIDDLRQRAEALEEVDPRSADGMEEAADTAEQQNLDEKMQDAAEQMEQNQMRGAQRAQQQASETMQQMLEQMQENKRAKAQDLLRQLASLLESIERLIVVQEGEITSLAQAQANDDYTGRDRAMIRLNQNTIAVAGEARAAGPPARRIARTLDRAGDAQGAAVTALRAQPLAFDAVNEAEERSLTLLKEAKDLAEELQQQTQEQETRRRRGEIIEKYRGFAERQIALREEALPLSDLDEMTRRQLIESRRLGMRQDDLGTAIQDLHDTTPELRETSLFTHAHEMIAVWSAEASEQMQTGAIDIEVTDRQQWIADSIGRLIEAMEEEMMPPDEFAQDQPQEEGGAGQQQQQPEELIPPIAEIKLLKGLQTQVYERTRRLDSRDDLTDAQRRGRLRSIGNEQRSLQSLGQELIDKLSEQQNEPEVTPRQP